MEYSQNEAKMLVDPWLFMSNGQNQELVRENNHLKMDLRQSYSDIQRLERENKRLKEELERVQNAISSNYNEADAVITLKAQIQMMKLQLEDRDDTNECKICMNAPIAASLNCGHVFCRSCAKKFLDKKCPHCNTNVVGIQRIFFS